MTGTDTVEKFGAWQTYKAQVSLRIIEFHDEHAGSNMKNLLEELYDINDCSIGFNAKLVDILANALPEIDLEMIRTWIADNIVPFVDSGTPYEDAIPLVRLAY